MSIQIQSQFPLQAQSFSYTPSCYDKSLSDSSVNHATAML